MILRRRLIRSVALACLISFLLVASSQVADGRRHHDSSAGRVDNHEEWEAQRLAAKPWYVKNIQIGSSGFTLPFSYVTLLLGWCTLYWIVSLFTSGKRKDVYVVASHILVTDLANGKKQLEDLKAEVGSNYELFAQRARKVSTCPSRKNGGNLGRFPPGVMAPSFDKLCFDPSSAIQTALGPIQSPFGYHLIYIHERKLP